MVTLNGAKKILAREERQVFPVKSQNKKNISMIAHTKANKEN